MRVWFDPSGFIKSVLDVCSIWVLLSISVLCSPAEVNLRTIWRRQLLHITTPCQQPDLVSSSTVVNGLSFGAVALLYSKGSAQGWGLLRASSGFGESLVYPSPPDDSLSPANLLYREDFPKSTHGVGVTLIQDKVVNATWQLDGVRIWKLSRAYPDEKPPSFSVLTHKHSLAKRKPTRHLLAMPCILVRIRAPY